MTDADKVVRLYGGNSSIDHRADGVRQAEDYRASQRRSDWEKMAQAEATQGGWGFLLWCALGVIAIGAFAYAVAS